MVIIKRVGEDYHIKTKKPKLFYKKKVGIIKRFHPDKSTKFIATQKQLKNIGLIGLKTKVIQFGDHQENAKHLFIEGLGKRLIESNKRRENTLLSPKEAISSGFSIDSLMWDKFNQVLSAEGWKKEAQVHFYLNPITLLLEPIFSNYTIGNNVQFHIPPNLLKTHHYQANNYMKYFEQKQHTLTPRSSVLEITESIIIPEGFTVQLYDVDTINLINHSSIWSYSPLFINDSSAHKTFFTSSDSTGQGVHLINAGSESKISNCDFTFFTNYSNGKHILPSCITFYQSPLVIRNCTFSSFKGEDMVNVFRSNFTVQNSSFNHSFSDQLDIDFGTGLSVNNTFNLSGNDGIDVSGGKVQIKKCFFKEVMDKAISAGEKSTIEIDSCTITKSSLAIVSKDKSKVYIQNSTLENIEVAYCAFNKKIEFGPSSITSINTKVKNYKEFHFIEKGSKIKLEGKVIKGKITNLKKYLNGNEYGAKTVK